MIDSNFRFICGIISYEMLCIGEFDRENIYVIYHLLPVIYFGLENLTQREIR